MKGAVPSRYNPMAEHQTVGGNESSGDAEARSDFANAIRNELYLCQEAIGQRLRLADVQDRHYPFSQAQLEYTQRVRRESMEREEREQIKEGNS